MWTRSKMKTFLKRKESVGIPNIHEIAPRDRIKPVENFRGFYPLNSWPPSSSDSPLPLVSQIPKAPLVAPEPKLVTLRWLPRRTNPRLKRKLSPICPQVGVKARCLNHLSGSWRIWVSSKSRAWANGPLVKENITLWKVLFRPLCFAIL